MSIGTAWQIVGTLHPPGEFHGKVCTTTYVDDPVRNPAPEQEAEKAKRAGSGKRTPKPKPVAVKASSAWFTPGKTGSWVSQRMVHYRSSRDQRGALRARRLDEVRRLARPKDR